MLIGTWIRNKIAAAAHVVFFYFNIFARYELLMSKLLFAIGLRHCIAKEFGTVLLSTTPLASFSASIIFLVWGGNIFIRLHQLFTEAAQVLAP